MARVAVKTQPPVSIGVRASRALPILHLWSAYQTKAYAAISASDALVDAAGNAAGVFGSGTGANPSGNSVQFGAGDPAIYFDPAGTGQLASTQLKVGDSGGSGAPNVGSFSIIARVWRSSVSTDTVVIYGGGSASVGLRTNNSGQMELLRTNQALLGTSTGTLSSSTWHTIGVAYDGVNGTFYIDGKSAGTFSGSSSFTHATQHYLGSGASGEWVSNITMRMRYVAVLAGAQPASVFARVHQMPGVLWQAPRKPSRAFAVGGGGVTITATTGAAVAAGLSAAVASPITVAGAVGAALANDYAAEVSSPITIAASPGAAVASDYAANVASAITVAGSVGAAVGAGLSASVSSGATISATTGAAIGAGLAAGVASPITVAASVGAATASGLSAGISTGNEIAAGTGSAVGAGLAAIVSSPITVAGSVGAATAAGLHATVSTGATVPAGLGAAIALGLTGNVAGQIIIPAALGRALAAGLQSSITVGDEIAASVGAATAAGLAATVANPTVALTAATGTRGGYGVQMQLAARRAQIQTGRRRN